MNIRPEIIEIDKETLVIEYFTKQKDYSENEFTDILIFPTLIFSKRKNNEEKFTLPIDEKMFTNELGYSFNRHTYGVGKIISLAEINYDTLHNFIKKYFEKNKIDDFYKRSSECKEVEDYEISKNIEILTFGNLKNLIRLIVKTDKAFYNIEELNNEKKRKLFRKTYENYVLDRDRFTHGKLYFLYPSFDPVLRIKDKNGKRSYINYSKEIFISNISTFDFLTDILYKMNKVLE